jgi:hypothetical protein
MAMQYDVKSTYLTADNTVYSAPARIKGILITPTTGSGGLSLKDGGSGGVTVFQSSWAANANPVPFYVALPGEGIRCSTDIYADVTTVTSITVFYG